MSWMRLTAFAALGTVTLALGGTARAQGLFFSDNFNSVPTGALLQDANWANHSGTGGSLLVDNPTGTQGVVVAAQQASPNNPTEDAHRDTGQSQAVGTTWYYAAKFTVADRRTVPGTGNIFPAYFLHFMEDTSMIVNQEQMFRGRLYVQGTTDPTKFTIGISSGTVGPLATADADFVGTQTPQENFNTYVDGQDFLVWQRNVGRAPTGTPPSIANNVGNANADLAVDSADLDVWKAQFGGSADLGQRLRIAEDLDFGTEYTVVVSYTASDGAGGSADDGVAKLWFGTDSATAAADTPLVDTIPNPNISNDATRPMKWLSIRQSTNGPATVNINSVAIGDDFNAVLAGLTPSATAAIASVPEPGAAGLLGMGLVALARRRRR
jgi:hypothetical protein